MTLRAGLVWTFLMLFSGMSRGQYQPLPLPVGPFGRDDGQTVVQSWQEQAPGPEVSPEFSPEELFPAPAQGGPTYEFAEAEPWSWHLMPSGVIYRSYLAGTKEPRMASVWTSDNRQGSVWDVTLGGRVAILRYGTCDSVRPQGWEVDIEGAAMPRLDPALESAPLVSTDYRFGIPVTWGRGPWQVKLAYYHISSHLGDEFMLLHPTFPRINYTRDGFVAGLGYFWRENFRFYGEMGYCAVAGGAEPIEFQFGVEYSPIRPGGAPFWALNGYTRQEVDFGGNFVAQCGWQWRGGGAGHLLRVGLEYYNGKSDQFEFFDVNENRIGGGIWYDF